MARVEITKEAFEAAKAAHKSVHAFTHGDYTVAQFYTMRSEAPIVESWHDRDLGITTYKQITDEPAKAAPKAPKRKQLRFKLERALPAGQGWIEMRNKTYATQEEAVGMAEAFRTDPQGVCRDGARVIDMATQVVVWEA